jgi:membrane protease YdiL (CAAX protease family)
VGIGLFFARRTGLGAPIVEGWQTGAPVSTRLKSMLLPSFVTGVAGAVIATVVDRLIFRPLLPDLVTVITQIGGWQGILASFYGGILEELEMRLLLVSAFAWLFGKLSHTASGAPSPKVLWLSTFIAAIIFALGHLPATSLTMAITPMIIIRSLVLNGGLGLVYGYIYWKRGLEAAMLAHFSTDFIVHFVLSSL